MTESTKQTVEQATQVESSESQQSQSSKEKSSKKKSNKGCFIVAAVGCGLVLLLVGLFVAFLVVIGISAGDSDTSVSEKVVKEGTGGKVAVIEFDGIITQDDMTDSVLGASGISYEKFAKQMDRAKNDDSVEGVLIEMNSPGGEVVASDLMYEKVLEVKEEKPVVTWISSTGASGGYYVAVATDTIIAHPDTITGSIGVILEVSSLEGLYKKLGIDTRVFKSGEFKDNEGLFDENPDGEADQIFQNLVDHSYENFVDAIVEGRELDRAKVKELGDGRIYTSEQAVDNGLIDKIGYKDDAVEELEELTGKSDLMLIEYQTDSFWESFYGYEMQILNNLGLINTKQNYGVKMYYLLYL